VAEDQVLASERRSVQVM